MIFFGDFPLFSHMKIHKFGIAAKRRFSSFIWRGQKKNFQPKIFFGLRLVAPFDGAFKDGHEIGFRENPHLKVFSE